MCNLNNSNTEFNTEFNLNEVCHDISNLKNVVTSIPSNDEQVSTKLDYMDKLIEALYYKNEINKINNILEYGHIFRKKPIETSELKRKDEVIDSLWGTDAFDRTMNNVLRYLDSNIDFLSESLSIYYDAICSHYSTFYGYCNYGDFKKSSQVR